MANELILIVEDNDKNRKLVRDVLQFKGYRLAEAETGEEGAQYIAAMIPLTYYLRIVRGIVLKGAGIEYLWPNALSLVAFGTIVFGLAVLRFRKQLG